MNRIIDWRTIVDRFNILFGYKLLFMSVVIIDQFDWINRSLFLECFWCGLRTRSGDFLFVRNFPAETTGLVQRFNVSNCFCLQKPILYLVESCCVVVTTLVTYFVCRSLWPPTLLSTWSLTLSLMWHSWFWVMVFMAAVLFKKIWINNRHCYIWRTCWP